MRLLGWTLVQFDRCLYQERNFGHTENWGDTHGGARPCEGAMKGAICKPRTEPSGGTKPRDAWILAFQPPELGENEILPSKPLGLWYSVVAALAI